MKLRRKITSLLLCAAMLFSAVPQTAYAENTQASDTAVADGLCEHHAQHDESCGYTEGTPCQYECKICAVQELIDALPDAADITADTAAEVDVQLDAIDTLLSGMTEEETTQVDQARFDATLEAYNTVVEQSAPTCICTTPCSEGEMNTECPVCGAKDAAAENCNGAVNLVQGLIDALPALSEMENMNDDDLQAAMEQYAAASEAYNALSEEQKAQVTGADVLDEFNAMMNAGVPLQNGVHESHPVCGTSCTDGENHVAIEWTEWTGGDSMPTTAGNYYLSADVTLSATWEVPVGETKLCLNGHSITYSNDSVKGSVIHVPKEATMTLSDCSGDQGKITGGTGRDYSSVGLSRTSGGGISVDGTLYMYGGDITNNAVEYLGGNTDLSGNGGGVFCAGGSEFYMYGGKISNNEAIYGGGLAVRHSAKAYVSGGEISNNKGYIAGVFLEGKYASSTTEGETAIFTLAGDAVIKQNEGRWDRGAVYCWGRGTINMEGGLITENNGCGVTLNQSGTEMNMTGGEILNNESHGILMVYYIEKLNVSGGKIAGKNNSSTTYGIYVDTHILKTAPIGLSGNPDISSIYLNDTYEWSDENKKHQASGKSVLIQIEGKMTNTTPIPIAMRNRGTFTNDWTDVMGADVNYNDYFTGANQNDKIEYLNNELRIIPLTNHYNSADAKTFETDFSTIPPTNGVMEITSNGSYYLSNNIMLNALDNTLYIGDGENAVTVDLCLSGYQLSVEDGISPVIIVRENATLNLYDCKDYNTAAREHSYMSPITNSSQTVNGGLITGGAGRTATKDGKTYTFGGGVLVYGTLNMYGGTIAGNKAEAANGGFGGGVFVTPGGTFNLNGGEVKDNLASTSGGGVTVAGADDAVPVSTPIRNSLDIGGSSGGSATIEDWIGGYVEGNNATMNSLSDGNDSGVSPLTNGTANADFTLKGGSVTGNKATSYGGGINARGTTTIQGGSVMGNTAQNGGGVYVGVETTSTETTATIKGGSITGNTATSYGGGVYASTGGVTMVTSGSVIRIADNTQGENVVSNLFVEDGVNITVGNSKLTNGSSIGIRMENAPGQFATTDYATKTDLVPYFNSDHTEYAVGVTAQGLKLGLAPEIADITLPDGTVSESYNNGNGVTLSAAVTGGENPTITWSTAKGSSLPEGLSLSEAGLISGTPNYITTSTFTVQATYDGVSATKELTLKVNGIQLSTPTQFNQIGGWTQRGSVFWTPVENAQRYLIQLYDSKGNAVGNPAIEHAYGNDPYIIKELDSLLEYARLSDGTQLINTTDSYSLTITALGDNHRYANSDPTEKIPATHIVTFNSNGGTSVDPMMGITGTSIRSDKIPTSTKAGYTLVDWYYDEEFKSDWGGSVNSSFTVYAKWALNAPTVDVTVAPTTGSAEYTGNTAVTLTANPSHTLTQGITYSYKWYKVGADGTGEKVENATGNELQLTNVSDSGNYYVEVTATDSAGLTSSVSTQNSPTSVTIGAKQLDSPSNINWDGKVASWDGVTNADDYTVTLYKKGENGADNSVVKSDTTSNTKYDFTSYIKKAGIYYVTVVANGSGNYANSQPAESSEVKNVGTATQEGSKHEECTACGYKKDPVTIPDTGTSLSTEAPSAINNSSITLWLVVLLMSGGAFLALIFRRRMKWNTDK